VISFPEPFRGRKLFSIYRNMSDFSMWHAKRLDHVLDRIGNSRSLLKFKIPPGGSEKVIEFTVEAEPYADAGHSSYCLAPCLNDSKKAQVQEGSAF